MIAQFNHTLANPQSPELIVSSSTTGVDLVLFYISRLFETDYVSCHLALIFAPGYCSFIISALLVMFWYVVAPCHDHIQAANKTSGGYS